MNEVTPGIDNGTPKNIQISAKTPHEWLEEQRKELTTWNVRNKLADEIITNAREVTSKVNWVEILDNVVWIANDKSYHGKAAIANSVATTVGSIAREMGWSMDSPQVVYMSVSTLTNFLGRRLAYWGEVTGKSEERNAEVARLATFSHRITEALDSYIADNLPEVADPNYRKALDKLPFTGNQSMILARGRALTAFKKGNFEQAVSELNSPLQKGKGRGGLFS